jgi:hypothetical protein
MKPFRALTIMLLTFLTWSGIASSQEPITPNWTKLTRQPAFYTDTALLLTDGTVMMHQYNGIAWWRLTPDITGSYINGTWSALASMQKGYRPLYFASAVLPDGRVLVEGGEYNNLSEAETNQGSIYNPATNTWTKVSPPAGWSAIGDSPSIVLPDGTFMMGQGGQASTKQVTFDATTLTWAAVTDNGKADYFSEEGWTLLPDGDVLTVDVWNGKESELYDPASEKWTLAGSTVAQLANTSCDEIGPAILRPQGSVFAAGATNRSAIYITSTGTWRSGPSFPTGYGIADGPAAILPDGNVLVQTSPITPCYTAGSKFFEFNGTTLTLEPGTTYAAQDPSFVGRMLVLPTGQVLFVDGSKIVEVYTAAGTYNPEWQPTITSVAATLNTGSTNNSIQGTQFNGRSQGAAYGDDAQMATNYPLVRIVNDTTKHVFYARTHDHSTMAVATGSAIVSTYFDIPADVETGASEIYVVANGIPSKGAKVTIE